MEVILRDHVENVGKRGEVVKVADGYARNYLLPRKLALIATPGNLKQIERERVKLDAMEAEERRPPRKRRVAKMSGSRSSSARKVGETGALYGSVTSADIAEALGEAGLRDRQAEDRAARADQEAGRADGAGEAAPEVVVQLPVRSWPKASPKSRRRS